MHFSKTLDKFGKYLWVYSCFYQSYHVFLNTGVILASFIDDGNIPSANDLLNSSGRIGVEISILSLITLVGISESCAALELDRFFNSFSISFA